MQSHELQTPLQPFNYISISISSLTFIGILLYHTYKQVASGECPWLGSEKTENPQRVLSQYTNVRKMFLTQKNHVNNYRLLFGLTNYGSRYSHDYNSLYHGVR